MSAHVLKNLSNAFGKRGKMQGEPKLVFYRFFSASLTWGHS